MLSQEKWQETKAGLEQKGMLTPVLGFLILMTLHQHQMRRKKKDSQEYAHMGFCRHFRFLREERLKKEETNKSKRHEQHGDQRRRWKNDKKKDDV